VNTVMRIFWLLAAYAATKKVLLE